jgi:hypothetical protein
VKPSALATLGPTTVCVWCKAPTVHRGEGSVTECAPGQGCNATRGDVVDAEESGRAVLKPRYTVQLPRRLRGLLRAQLATTSLRGFARRTRLSTTAIKAADGGSGVTWSVIVHLAVALGDLDLARQITGAP